MQNFPICTLIEEESRGELKLMMRKLDSGEPGKPEPKLYSPSNLNTDYLLWHRQLIVCAVK